MFTEQGSGGYGWKSVAQARGKRGHGSAEEEGEGGKEKRLGEAPPWIKYLKFTKSSQGFRYSL